MLAAVAALVVNNTHWQAYYHDILYQRYRIDLGFFHLAKQSLIIWINDGLMTFFFLLVGLEIKREMSDGELQSPSQIMLPVFAAFGGMVVPALVFLLLNMHIKMLEIMV